MGIQLSTVQSMSIWVDLLHENTLFSHFIKEHVAEKYKNQLKYYSFLNRNSDLPFIHKLRVLDACLISAIIYGCESWFSSKISKLNTLYLRKTCPNLVTLLEVGLPNLSAKVKERQFKFYKKMVTSRSHMLDDPFMLMLNVARQNKSPASMYIDGVLNSTDKSYITRDIEAMKDKIMDEMGSKFVMYKKLNYDLSKHEIYNSSEVPEYQRIAFSRYRTGSHLLKIETGRWSRVPRENRLCHCAEGSVQDEVHVIESCALLNETRSMFPELEFKAEVFFNKNTADVAKFITKAFEILL